VNVTVAVGLEGDATIFSVAELSADREACECETVADPKDVKEIEVEYVPDLVCNAVGVGENDPCVRVDVSDAQRVADTVKVN
jgi:hypothetical protein